MQLPFIPTNPTDFARLMEEIWAMDSVPAEDGGVTLYGSPLYDYWHNAVKTAEAIGMVRTGGSKRNGEHGHIYRFPSGDGVFINLDGTAIDSHTNRFWSRGTITERRLSLRVD